MSAHSSVASRSSSYATDSFFESGESEVLVIYTGGTIGMMRNENGALAPAPANELVAELMRNPYLHDEPYAVRQHVPGLVLPDCKEKNRVIYKVFEYEPVLDSSNMTVAEWMHIAKDIRDNYEKYDGFVILHGTDTLAYTASVLSFMLENLGKSVILTGSQIPIFEKRGDGLNNLLGSLNLAGNYTIPEVGVFFNDKLFRGNRTVKISATSLNAFDSPNLPPLATISMGIEVNYRAIFRQCNIDRFRVQSSLNRNVGLLRLFPSITTTTVKNFLKPPTMGVVLQTYGAGNMPSNRQDLLDEIEAATARGVLVVNITQCMTGSVSDQYETGQALTNAGVISGSDMTPEAALTKLSYVLSKTDWDLATKRRMIQNNLRGELTIPGQLSLLKEWDLVDSVAHSLHVTSSKEVRQLGFILSHAMVASAVQQGNIEKLENLKQSGANFAAFNADNRTILHFACCEGNLEVVRYLLENGLNVHAKDRFDHTPLLDAINFDHHDVIKLLRSCGAHLFGNPRLIGEELCNSAAKGLVKRLRSYHYAGADLNQPDISERTALHVAAMHDNMECVSFLLLSHARTDAVDILGQTPLDIACKLNHSSAVSLLEAAKRGLEEENNENEDFHCLQPTMP